MNGSGPISSTSTFVGATGSISNWGPPNQQLSLTTTVTGAGWSLGNSWSVNKSILAYLTVFQRGIAQGLNINFKKLAVGDTAGIYSYCFSDGGVTAGSDEGVTGANFESGETSGYFHGTVSSTTGTGDQTPVLNYTSGNAWTTDGAFLLNISKGTIAGSLNGPSAAVSGAPPYINALPVTDVTISGLKGSLLPPTTAWGTVAAGIPNPSTTADVSTPTTVTVTLGLIGAAVAPFVAGGVVTIAGPNYPEQAAITFAGAVTNGTQQITLSLRNPNGPNAVIFQGGIAGQYISFDANLAFSGYRSSYYALGSFTGSDLIYGFNIAGNVGTTLPQIGSEAATTSGANSGFHLYPGAEIVNNEGTGYTPKLEPNAVPWVTNDVVENPHYPAFGGNGAWITRQQFTPTNASYGSNGLHVDVAGTGISRGFKGFRLRNSALASQYASSGGPISGPTAVSIEGQWDSTFYIEYGPASGVPMILVSNFAGGAPAASLTTPIPVIEFNQSVGGQLNFTPSTGVWGVYSLSASNLAVGNVTLSGSLSVSGSNVSTFDRINCNHITSASNSSFQNVAITFDITSVRSISANGTVSSSGVLKTTGTFSAGSTGQLGIDTNGDLATTGFIKSSGLATSIVTKTAAYSASAYDYTVLSDASGGAFTVSLPTSPQTGQIIVVKKIDSSSNVVTVSASGKNIDGGSTYSISTQYTAIRFQYGGTQWWTI